MSACLLISVILWLSCTAAEARAAAGNTETRAADDDSVQQEVRKFYSSLNVEEKAQLKNFAKTSAANFSLTDSQFMDGLKDEAAGLFGKLSGFRDAINAKLDTMQPESRIFIEQVLRKFLAAFSQDGILNIIDAMKGLGKEVLDMYDRLPKPTQDDVLKAFPTIGSFATSDVIRLVLQKVAEFDLVSKTWTPAPTVDLDVDDLGKAGPKKSRHHSPSPEPIDDPAEPEARASDHGKKGLKTTALYPSVGDEEETLHKHLIDTE